MPEFERIKRNIGKMIAQNAPESDIDEYISSEDVTAEQLRAAPKVGERPIEQAPSDPRLRGFALGGEFAPAPFKVPEIAKQAILPTLGGIAGIPLGLGGIAGGSFIGEAVSQGLGISPRSNLQLALAGGLPMVPSVIKRGGSVIKPFMTSKMAARTLNMLGPKEAERVISKLAPEHAHRLLFEQAFQQGGRIEMTNTLDDLERLIAKMRKGSTAPGTVEYLQRLWDKIAGGNGILDPENLQQELEIFGKMVQKLERAEGSPYGAGKKVFESMMKDLDSAITRKVPGADMLKLARDTFKRASSVEELWDYVKAAIKPVRGQGEFRPFNAAEVIRKVEADRFFTESFTTLEQKEIIGLLNKLNRIPALSPGAGQQFGSGRFWHTFSKMGAAGGGGASVGFLFGRPDIGAGIGFGLGVADIAIGRPARDIAFALSMKEGRVLLGKLLTKDGTLTEKSLAVLTAFSRAQMAPTEAEVSQVPSQAFGGYGQVQ